MFRKKKEKFNLYLDDIDYMDSEDDLLDEELLDDELLEEEIDLSASQLSDDLLMDDMDLLAEELEEEQDINLSGLSGTDITGSEPAIDEAAVFGDIPAEDDNQPADGEAAALSSTASDEGASDVPAKKKKKKPKKKGLFRKRKKKKSSGKSEKKKEKTPKEKKPLFKKKKKNPVPQPGQGLEEPKKKLSPKKIALIAAACIIVVGAGLFFLFRHLGGSDESKAYVESVGELTGLGSANGMSNRYTGEVEAQDSWKISLQSDMTVAKCYVNVGDEVKKGDKLFSYNTEELKLNKEKKELEVETLTNEMNQLTKDIAGYQNDLKSASASEKIELQTQILTAQTTIKKNEFTIKSSKEEIKTLEKNIKDATVKSKMAGLVKSINKSLGESSSDGEDTSDYDSGSGDSTYMTILALGDYRIKGKVSETNVWSLTEGDPVIIRSRVDENVTWTGTISKIKTDTNADSDSQESTESDYDMGETSKESASEYNFYVKLDEDEGLMLGQHVLIEIDNGQNDQQSGMWLDAAYLHKEKDQFYVWADNGKDRLTLRKVKTGNYNEDLDQYEILSGLTIKDYIACDAESLHENMRTTKVDPDMESTEYPDDGEEFDDGMYDDADIDDSDDTMLNEGEEGLGADELDDSSGTHEDDDSMVVID